MTFDQNGYNDLPEAEREGLEAWEDPCDGDLPWEGEKAVNAAEAWKDDADDEEEDATSIEDLALPAAPPAETYPGSNDPTAMLTMWLQQLYAEQESALRHLIEDEDRHEE